MSKTIETKDKDGKDITIVVRKPKPEHYNKANLAANALFAKLVSEVDENGKPVFFLRNQLNDIVKQRNLWSDAKEQEYSALIKDVNDNRRKLAAGGITLSDGRALAMKIRESVAKLRDLVAARNALDSLCVESKVEQERLNHLIVQCVLYDDGTPVFDSVDVYEQTEAAPWMPEVFKAVTEVIFGLDDNVDKNLPENKFLLKHKFASDKGLTRRSDGKLVDENGKLIDENGRYINEAGQFIDIDGNLVDADGFPLVEEPQPFLDDEGNPVSE